MPRKRRPRQLELEDQTAPVSIDKTRRRLPRRRDMRRRIAAVVGDALPAKLFGLDATTAVPLTYHVRPRCRASSRAWVCLSCAQYLRNEAQRDFHTETGAHVLARVCLIHGAEAPRRSEL